MINECPAIKETGLTAYEIISKLEGSATNRLHESQKGNLQPVSTKNLTEVLSSSIQGLYVEVEGSLFSLQSLRLTKHMRLYNVAMLCILIDLGATIYTLRPANQESQESQDPSSTIESTIFKGTGSNNETPSWPKRTLQSYCKALEATDCSVASPVTMLAGTLERVMELLTSDNQTNQRAYLFVDDDWMLLPETIESNRQEEYRQLLHGICWEYSARLYFDSGKQRT